MGDNRVHLKGCLKDVRLCKSKYRNHSVRSREVWAVLDFFLWLFIFEGEYIYIF